MSRSPDTTAKANYNALLPTINAIWQERVVEKLFQLPGSCLGVDLAAAKEKGYTQVRIKGVKYHVHKLAAMLSTQQAPNGREASHLCHNPACVNPDHLVFEDGEVNKSRGCCLLYGRVVGYKCPHNPTCWGCEAVPEVMVDDAE